METIIIKKTKKTANTSTEQKNILLEFMKKNPQLLRGKFSDKHTQKDAQRLWESISKTLNSCGNGANKDWKSWRKTWQDIRSRTKSRSSTYGKYRRGTGGGPYVENPNDTFEQKVLETINTVSVEGHAQVSESATVFVIDADDKENEPAEYENENEHAEYGNENEPAEYENENEHAEYGNENEPAEYENENDVSTRPILENVSPGPTLNMNNTESKSTVKVRPLPRAPRKKLMYAAEASNNYRLSLEKKNEMKSKYCEKKIVLLERIATAKERSAAAKEQNISAIKDIAHHLGCLTKAVEALQDAIF